MTGKKKKTKTSLWIAGYGSLHGRAVNWGVFGGEDDGTGRHGRDPAAELRLGLELDLGLGLGMGGAGQLGRDPAGWKGGGGEIVAGRRRWLWMWFWFWSCFLQLVVVLVLVPIQVLVPVLDLGLFFGGEGGWEGQDSWDGTRRDGREVGEELVQGR